MKIRSRTPATKKRRKLVYRRSFVSVLAAIQVVVDAANYLTNSLKKFLTKTK